MITHLRYRFALWRIKRLYNRGIRYIYMSNRLYYWYGSGLVATHRMLELPNSQGRDPHLMYKDAYVRPWKVKV